MERVDPVEAWLAALDERHRADLDFKELRRGIQALSSLYVERRDRLRSAGGPLRGAGKRAAFAAFFGPLHFLTVRRVVRELGAASPAPSRILDLGCGTGAAGAAWALEAGARADVLGYDVSSWVLEEARWTYQTLGIRGRARRGDLERVRLPGGGGSILLAFTVNELEFAQRPPLLRRLLVSARRGSGLLVVEPISRRVAPWWRDWSDAVCDAGGRSDEWRFTETLPASIQRLDRAAGLDHGTLTARSLWIPPTP
jgi:SAM-dependent methyltransferase